jgi:hypothetical protein
MVYIVPKMNAIVIPRPQVEGQYRLDLMWRCKTLGDSWQLFTKQIKN